MRNVGGKGNPSLALIFAGMDAVSHTNNPMVTKEHKRDSFEKRLLVLLTSISSRISLIFYIF